MKKLFEELELLLFVNKIDELVPKLISFLNEKELEEDKNQVILLGSRYNELYKEKLLGIISYENFSTERAKIVYGFTYVITDLKKQYKNDENNIIDNIDNVSDTERLTQNEIKSISRDFSESRGVGFYSNLLNISKNVCRIEIDNKSGFGTGFIFRNGWLLTNHFILPSKETIEDAIAQFNYEEDEHRVLKQIYTYKLDRDNVILNKEVNYTFVKLIENDNAPKLVDFMNFNLSSTPIIKGQNVIIIQHPFAKTKEIDINAKIIDTEKELTMYNGITHPGSSGAPILNNEFELLGIHLGRSDDGQNKLFIPIHKIINSLEPNDYNLIMQ